MDKYNFFSNDNMLILAADDGKKSGKKGDGINAILGLLQELRTFSDKLQAAADAQDITENRQAIEAIGQELDNHSEKLLDIVKGGIKSIRNKGPVSGMEEAVGGSEGAVAPSAPSLPATPSPLA